MTMRDVTFESKVETLIPKELCVPLTIAYCCSCMILITNIAVD